MTRVPNMWSCSCRAGDRVSQEHDEYDLESLQQLRAMPNDETRVRLWDSVYTALTLDCLISL